MKIEFELVEKEFTNENGEPIKYKVLRRKLIDNTFIEIPINKIKDSKLLMMSLALENKIAERR